MRRTDPSSSSIYFAAYWSDPNSRSTFEMYTSMPLGTVQATIPVSYMTITNPKTRDFGNAIQSPKITALLNNYGASSSLRLDNASTTAKLTIRRKCVFLIEAINNAKFPPPSLHTLHLYIRP